MKSHTINPKNADQSCDLCHWHQIIYHILCITASKTGASFKLKYKKEKDKQGQGKHTNICVVRLGLILPKHSYF